METYKGCKIPKELYYDIENQVWYRLEEDGTVRVGATDVGQTRAGRMVNVRIKPPGKHVPKGKPIASLESGKWTGPVPAVIEGEVVERNEKLFDQPDLINDDPYGEGWIARLKPTELGKGPKGPTDGRHCPAKDEGVYRKGRCGVQGLRAVELFS